MTHLWEAKHPYYMNEGSYYATGCHDDFECFADFLSEWGDVDIDYNRLHRWDWKEGEDWGVESDGSEDVMGVLSVYFIMQRKARTYSCDIKVRRSDENIIREYLQPHMNREAAIWFPMTPQGGK